MTSRNTGMNHCPLRSSRIPYKTANFDAEYGRNRALKRPRFRKQEPILHGDVWEFLRNNDLNARSFFAPTVPLDKENQFGGAVGGPIMKNKLFYFGSVQALIKRPQGVSNVATVPTAAERSGDFTADLPGTVLSNPISPLTGAPLTTPGGLRRANNVIAPSCLSATTQQLLNYVPSLYGLRWSYWRHSRSITTTFLAGSMRTSSKQTLFGYSSWITTPLATRRMAGILRLLITTSPEPKPFPWCWATPTPSAHALSIRKTSHSRAPVLCSTHIPASATRR